MNPIPVPASAASVDPPAARDGMPRPWVSRRGILILFIVAVAIRWIYSAIRQLVPDEAYYWVWSRHLALSYFDHPPAVAYLIRLGTLTLGQTELGVRWPAALLAMGSVLIMAWIAEKMFRDPRAVAFVAVMLFVSPMINIMGSIVTPDTPACFFQAAALACSVWIFLPADDAAASRRRAPMWLLVGFLMGLALLSKYPSILLAGSLFLALICSPHGRRHLSTPWPWLGALIAAAIFSPVIIWNAEHHWASFVFQVHHGMGAGDSRGAMNLLSYIGGQAAVATPVLFAMILTAIVIYFRRWKTTPMHLRIILMATVTPLIFFACSSLRKRVEANWPVFSYFPGTLLVADYLCRKWTGRRIYWAGIAAKVALVATIIVHIPEITWAVNPKWGALQWSEMFGHRELAAKVHEIAGPVPVFGGDYRDASELSFYLPGKPQVWPLQENQRATAYDYFPGRPTYTDFNSIVFVRNAPKNQPVPVADVRLRHAFTRVQIVPFSFVKQGRTVQQCWIMIATK